MKAVIINHFAHLFMPLAVCLLVTITFSLKNSGYNLIFDHPHYDICWLWWFRKIISSVTFFFFCDLKMRQTDVQIYSSTPCKLGWGELQKNQSRTNTLPLFSCNKIWHRCFSTCMNYSLGPIAWLHLLLKHFPAVEWKSTVNTTAQASTVLKPSRKTVERHQFSFACLILLFLRCHGQIA